MKLGESRELPECACINCGKRLDRASSVDEEDATPSPGDFTVCLECGHIMVFGDDLMLRDPRDDEFAAIAGDQRIIAIQKVRGKVFGNKS